MGADRIVNGGLVGGTDAVDSPGSMVVDSLNGLLGIVTNTHQIAIVQSALALIPAQTALTAITTAQNLLSKPLAAGALNVVGRTLQVTGSGVYSSTGGSTPTITIALKLGSVALCSITTAAINTAASTNLQFKFSFTLTVVTTGTGATIEAHGEVDINLSANTPGTALSVFADQNTGVSGAVDLTIAETLVVTVAASGAIPSAQLRLGSVQILG